MANPNFVTEHSTYEIWRADDTSRCLDDDLVAIEQSLEGKAPNNHTHDGYAEAEHTHTEYAPSTHSHTGYAPSTHSHDINSINGLATLLTNAQTEINGKASTQYVDESIANLVNNSTAAVDSITELASAMEDNADAIDALVTIAGGKAAADHTHGVATTTTAGFQSPNDKAKLDGIEAGANNYTHPTTHPMSMIEGLESALGGKAANNHSHSGYAASDHSHSGYAASNHSHSGYAASNHSHSGYASSDHNHDDEYFSKDGGTIDGDTNVAGVLRVQSQQAFYFASSTMSQTLGTNNATGGTTICCGPSADVNVNGANMKASNILPKTNNAYTLGNTSYRFKGIYSTAAVNVSSDERLKRDIKSMDIAELAKFVEGLNVVSYNYNDDEADRKARIGLIAQQVQEADENMAKFFVNEEDDGMLSLAPADLVFALIATVQELKKEVTALKARKK